MINSKGYVDKDYLLFTAQLFERVKERSYSLLRLNPAAIVIDVGCGCGIDTCKLSSIVGENGIVIGVDLDIDMLRDAIADTERSKIENIRYELASAYHLPFSSNYFDASRNERLFQHLLEPEMAFLEMIRVTKSGGWITVIDTDWGTLSIDGGDLDDVERRLVRFTNTHNVENPYSGRKLYRLCKTMGLINVSVEIFPLIVTDYEIARRDILQNDESEQDAVSAGVITLEELSALRSGLEKANKMDGYFGSVNLVLVSGQKP